MPHRWIAALAACAVLGLPLGAQARPFTVDDLLRQQQVTGLAADPNDRWLVFEQTDPYDSARRFDEDLQSRQTLSRLYVVDLRRPAAARPLIPGEAGRGVTIAGFSPSGARLAVFRLRDRRRSLGIVTLATRRVRWFDLTPDWNESGRSVQWRDDAHLLVIARPDRSLSIVLRRGHASADTLPALWAASARGEVSDTVLRSGAYAAERPRPAPRALLQLDVVSGARRRLATGEFTDLEISPSHEDVALLEAGEDIQPQRDGPSQGDWGTATPASHLVLLDLATGTRRTPIPQDNVLPTLLAWSPSGTALLVLARPPRSGWSAARLLRVGARDGDVTPIGQDLQPQLRPRPEVAWAGWMGETPVVLARPKATPGARADWYRLTASGALNLTRALPAAPPGLAGLDPAGMDLIAGGALWRVDPQGGAVRLDAGPVAALHAPRPAEGRPGFAEPAASAVVTGGGATRALQWVDARGLRRVAALPTGDAAVVAALGRIGAAVVRATDPHRVETLRLVGGAHPPVTLARINARLADVDPEVVLPVRHRGLDGQALTSWLFLPRRAPGAPPPPLVVQVYAGNVYPTPPHGQAGVIGFATDVRMLTGHGYAVLTPSLPLTGDPHEPMAHLGEAILAAVEAVRDTPALAPQADTDRLAIWGHSYGGYTVMAAIGQTRRFRAAVSIAGVSDLTAMWASLPAAHRTAPEEGPWSNWNTGNTESGQNRMGVPPWRDPARYARNSPLLAADRIETPLLLFHGDQDFIPLAQSEAMFSALYRQDKDAQLVTYWGEGHYISSPGNVRDLYARAFAFLDARLTPSPGPPRAGSGRSPGPAPASGGPSSR
jgi:dipeptidyl aminopeptidase/acylaminoacyl peptidase